MGSETPLPDLILDHSDVPAYGLLGDQITIPFRIRSSSRGRCGARSVSRMRGWRGCAERGHHSGFGEVSDSMMWTPPDAGDYNLDLHLPVEADEAIKDNNDQRFRIAVRDEKLKVLVVDSLPSWEYRYLRNALTRDPGVECATLLFHPGMAPGEGLGYISVNSLRHGRALAV